MSDDPIKASSGAPEPLDDIILGEDDDLGSTAASARPPVKPSVPPPGKPISRMPSAPPAASKGSVPPASAPAAAPEPTSSSKLRAAEAVDAKKQPSPRAKMTLRIPDDEISRPQLPPTTPGAGVAAVTTAPIPRDDRFDEAPPIKPQPILAASSADDTLELPVDELRARMNALTSAAGIDAGEERGWTPYQPSTSGGMHGRNGGATIVDVRERLPSEPPISEEIPIETEDVPDPSTEDLATRPRLQDGPDSEEIRVEEFDGERVSDPADAPEIDPDDLVSVESLPRLAKGADAAALTAGKHAAFKQPSAAALMSTATPQAPAVAATPASEAVPTPRTSSPSLSAPPPAPRISSPALPPLGVNTPATPFRPVQPGIVVPPVGALAPPPMTESAAARKKARPWWEELFNDDFIRTMAKISDSQIKGEVDFIEDSLGCEAGAMVLDLACGTGRHAVELASRGYQVVGFDLSLAMLARASDEAQERKQKINFVQGDMRDMTFDETFDGVYAWNTSFGFFDEEKNGAVIAKVHKSLKKGGQFLLDVVNRDYIVRQGPSLAWFEGEGCICMDEMQIDFITSRMKVKRTLMMDDGRTKEIEYSIRVYALHELGKMLHDNGFRVAEVSGRTGTPGVFFGCESPRTLILAEKR